MKDLHKKTTDDLDKLLFEKRKALYDFRIGIAGSKIKNVKEARILKREIAKILTNRSIKS